MSRRAVEMSELVRWGACALVVLCAHASAAAIMANWTDPVASSEPAGAITIDLAPVATSTADAQEDVAPGPPMVQADAPPVQAPDRTAEDTPVEETVAERKVAEETVVDAKAEPRPADEPQVDPAPLAPAPEVTAALPAPPAKPVKRREKPRPKRTPAPATTAPQRAPQLAALSAAPAQGQVSASSRAMPSWKGQILAAIERSKRYPGEAEARREQGTPLVSFSIDRGGRLLTSRIVRASGHAALDQEALAILRRAQPFPPAPADIAGANFNFTVPITFRLR